jgi:hypothetical protein
MAAFAFPGPSLIPRPRRRHKKADCQLGICAIRAYTELDLRGRLSVSDRERPSLTEANGPLMAWWSREPTWRPPHDAYACCPWNLPTDRLYLAGGGPVPWPGSLPGPWFLARVLLEAQCQGWPKAISEGNAKRP